MVRDVVLMQPNEGECVRAHVTSHLQASKGEKSGVWAMPDWCDATYAGRELIVKLTSECDVKRAAAELEAAVDRVSQGIGRRRCLLNQHPKYNADGRVALSQGLTHA